MGELDFLHLYGDEGTSNATLYAVLQDGQVCCISDHISPYKIYDLCPLLYHAFDYGHQCSSQASIEAPSRLAAISLLRYCYTGSYLPEDGTDTPSSLLHHVEVYKLATDFHVPALQLLAHGSFFCQIDVACSLPSRPPDLLETIKFVYKHYASQQARFEDRLIDTLINYCISNFSYHKLGESAEFLKVVDTFPAFHQDLCRANLNRNFEDEGAVAIINLALNTMHRHRGIRPTTLASRDLPKEMLFDPLPLSDEASTRTLVPEITTIKSTGEDDTDSRYSYDPDEISSCKSDDIAEIIPMDKRFVIPCNHWNTSATTLIQQPERYGQVSAKDSESDVSSDEDGFVITRHPKRRVKEDNSKSSLDKDTALTANTSQAIGDEMPNDEDWDLLEFES